MRRVVVRWFAKCVFFIVLVAVVLNPDLRRAAKQLRHTLAPEALIQTNFPGLLGINRGVDRMWKDRGGAEAKTVEQFVLRNVRYASDYDTWNNIEYWPTAEECWSRGQEDCDGRAVLAVSILRSRGYESAKLVVGLQHMWIRVNENEKRPDLAPSIIGLLNPAKRYQFEIHNRPNAAHYLSIVRTLFHPTALRDTGVGILAEVPPVRKALLMLVLLVLCYHPCRDRNGLLAVLVLGFSAANLLSQWDIKSGELQAMCGMALFLVAVVGALLLSRKNKLIAISNTK
jgi:hypothetical protein